MLFLILMNDQICPVINNRYTIFQGSITGNTYHTITTEKYLFDDIGTDYDTAFVYVGF
jgi:hypothetical protein